MPKGTSGRCLLCRTNWRRSAWSRSSRANQIPYGRRRSGARSRPFPIPIRESRSVLVSEQHRDPFPSPRRPEVRCGARSGRLARDSRWLSVLRQRKHRAREDRNSARAADRTAADRWQRLRDRDDRSNRRAASAWHSRHGSSRPTAHLGCGHARDQRPIQVHDLRKQRWQNDPNGNRPRRSRKGHP